MPRESREDVREEIMWTKPGHTYSLLLVALLAAAATTAYDQAMAPTNSLPNPYRPVEDWAKLPDGRSWGSTSAVDVDREGKIWVADRCGANTGAGSNLPPIVKLDPARRPLKSFGAGLCVFRHGLHVDKDGTV